MPDFLPTDHAGIRRRGWDECDVVFVTPDAYVDHPSFAVGLLTRFLEKQGYRVGVLAQPRWKEPAEFLRLGRPRLAFVVSGGNVDSMVLNYTAAKKPRREDPYCNEGNPYFSRPGEGKKYRIRPDRVVTVYSSQIRAACSDVPVIIGGIEASLRRIAHYDYWSDSVRRSVLFDAKAQMLVYGMGEYPLAEALRLIEGGIPFAEMEIGNTMTIRPESGVPGGAVILPPYQEVKKERKTFARAFSLFYENCDRTVLAQQQDSRFAVQFPRRQITTDELDAVYDVPFMRRPHPGYTRIPAYNMIRDSVTSHRGCYGNCSFCSISAHQGSCIISRSEESILKEVREIARMPDFSGTITDIGGPSANMYASNCSIGGCECPDCLKSGRGCQNLVSGTDRYLALLQRATAVPGVKHVLVSSGLRFDPVLMEDRFLKEMLQRHIAGWLKIGLESGSDAVLALMNKPETAAFTRFKSRFDAIKKKEGIRKYINPYIIVGHPGEQKQEVEETLAFLLRHHLRGKQFQIFTPTPLTRSTAMYYLGYDPCTGTPVAVERDMRELEKRKARLISAINR